MSGNVKTMIPQYMNHFSCTGSKCEDTCCAGWAVFVDKPAYKQYQKVSDGELKEKFKTDLKRIKKDSNDHRYAVLKLDEEGYCSFLTEERLCSIQVTLGEKALCQTCSVYPRTINYVDDMIEMGSKLSCPETARLALLNKQPMEFDVVEQPAIYKLYNNKINTSNNTLEKYFWDLRIFVISLLQNRSYRFYDRLIILGMFCDKLESIYQNKTFELIPSVIGQFKQQIEQKKIDQFLSTIAENPHVSVKLLVEMLQIRNDLGFFQQRYAQFINETVESLKLESNNTNIVLERYIEGLRTIFEPFAQEHEYIFENYAVNYVFERIFLYESKTSLFKQYVQLVSILSLMKFQIIGVGLAREELTPEMCVTLIQSFSRNTEHYGRFLDLLVDNLEQTGLNSLALMVILLKS
ncbi:flagellin lysine-N-methylase [Paenibacillus sp. NPDC058071]|uniref:flagellin lysine-N-methylase n=1 Tax=Paenibacillus sp. NPDC058071 TaxID=3346326 RepID=UPI0036DB0EAF